MKKITTIIIIFAAFISVFSCDLTENQQATADRDMIFSSETGLQTYVYSFYDYMLPTSGNAFRQDKMSDYSANAQLSTYESGAYTTETSDSWSWSDLRNINYFLKYNTNEKIDETVRNNYNGIARFFRAYFYFQKLVKYGEVPWIDEPLENDDDRLYAARDGRDVIIGHIIDDLEYAYNNITETEITPNSNTINKWTAEMFKSRVCLFEASWGKYHANTNYVKGCTVTSDELYKDAADAAEMVIDNSPYSIYTGTTYSGGRGSYRELFISDDAVTDEVMLAISLDATLRMGEQNWWFNSSSYGVQLSMARPFALTYLNRDGTFYNPKNSDGSYKNFVQETSGRDLRLNQTIRGADYTCKNSSGEYVAASANFTGLTLTGYQYTKYVMDDVSIDDGSKNVNDIPIFRYAEVLLNYAEAKAELGTLTNEDWSKTIGMLRRRAGITGGDLDHKPTVIDSYLQKTFYPDVTDPVILEIRRERTCELCLEGVRMMDLKRWACGSLWKNLPWTGVYIPALDTPIDMNGDGTYDVFFTKDADYSGEYKSICVHLNNIQTVKASDDDPDGGYLYDNETARGWNDNMYLYPIPAQVIAKNPNIKQNPGW
ncbi:MAG: RagB/SusD family nutrient uptake outer membrane protein [Bacteroidales bacterium]|jgi:hypothetical protein|nr:RagB/SusD family nutrient uptake outer membrane protein [Bacteroidales bacterium]